MPRYVSLLRFTEQGAKAIKQSTTRAHDFAKAAANAGVKVEAQYWTAGSYDGVLILSGANEQSVLRILADLASLGNVRTQTLQAFSDQEFDAIVGK